MTAFTSEIVHGNAIGTPFGIATANLKSAPSDLKSGVHICRASLADVTYTALLHHGPRLTFGQGATTELHLLDYSGGDLYGQNVTVEPLKYLRETRQFSSGDALYTQIENDVLQAQKHFFRLRVKSMYESVSQTQNENLLNNAIFMMSEYLNRHSYKQIFAYAPNGHEVPFVQELSKKFSHILWCYPRIENENMSFYSAQYADLSVGKYNLLEPSDSHIKVEPVAVDLVLVPALFADKYKYRLGRGGGYYDGFLSDLPKGVKTLCVLPDFAVYDKIPTQGHDVPVDQIMSVPSAKRLS